MTVMNNNEYDVGKQICAVNIYVLVNILLNKQIVFKTITPTKTITSRTKLNFF